MLNILTADYVLISTSKRIRQEKQETIQAKNSLRVCELWAVSILQITQKSHLEGFEPKWQTDLDL